MMDTTCTLDTCTCMYNVDLLPSFLLRTNIVHASVVPHCIKHQYNYVEITMQTTCIMYSIILLA